MNARQPENEAVRLHRAPVSARSIAVSEVTFVDGVEPCRAPPRQGKPLRSSAQQPHPASPRKTRDRWTARRGVRSREVGVVSSYVDPRQHWRRQEPIESKRQPHSYIEGGALVGKRVLEQRGSPHDHADIAMTIAYPFLFYRAERGQGQTACASR